MNGDSYKEPRASVGVSGADGGPGDSGEPPQGVCPVHYVDAEAVAEVNAALEALDPDGHTERAVSAIADPTRLRILSALAVRPLCVCDIAEVAGVSQSGASHQLRVLRETGLVTFERAGRRAVYSLSEPGVARAIEALRELGEAAARLRGGRTESGSGTGVVG